LGVRHQFLNAASTLQKPLDLAHLHHGEEPYSYLFYHPSFFYYHRTSSHGHHIFATFMTASKTTTLLILFTNALNVHSILQLPDHRNVLRVQLVFEDTQYGGNLRSV